MISHLGGTEFTSYQKQSSAKNSVLFEFDLSLLLKLATMNLVSEDTEREDAERKQQILAFFKSDKHFLSQLLSYMAQPDDSMWAPIEIRYAPFENLQ